MKKCPLCDGHGFITRKGESLKSVDRVKTILALRKKGLSMQEIGGIVGLSSNSVFYHLRKNADSLKNSTSTRNPDVRQ